MTADHSAGRVELGMGAGWNQGEHRAFGFPFPPSRERFEMLEEQVEIVHRQWDRDEDAVTFQGAHDQLDARRAFPKPVADRIPACSSEATPGRDPRRWRRGGPTEYNTTFEAPEGVAAARARLDAACPPTPAATRPRFLCR